MTKIGIVSSTLIAPNSVSSTPMCAATTMTSGKCGSKEKINLIVKNPKTTIPVLIVMLIIATGTVGCTFTGAKINLDAKIEAGLKNSDPLVRQAWMMIREDIEQNEATSREIFGDESTTFTDAEITKLDLTDSFDDLQKGAVIEVYELNYRMRPKDPSKIMLAGGMQIEDDWLLEKSSMGSPYFVTRNIGGERTYIGTIYPEGEGQGVLDATLELLNRVGTKGGPNGNPLSLENYIKTAVRMNYRHIGWQSYTMAKETIGFVADAIIGALPETLDQTASEIDNESIAHDYWEQGSCIELVFDGDTELTYTLLGDIKRSYLCDRMLICLTKSEDVLFLSKDGVYAHTIGPLDAAVLKPVYDWLHGMEFVGYMGADRAEILGQKITVHKNADLERLPPGYDMRPIESAMSRSVAFYQAAYLRQYELIDMLATDVLKAEIEKWGDNSPSTAGDLMQLSNIIDVAFPVSVTEPVFSPDAPGRFKVSLGLDEKTTAVIELVKSNDGSILVDGFKIAAD